LWCQNTSNAGAILAFCPLSLGKMPNSWVIDLCSQLRRAPYGAKHACRPSKKDSKSMTDALKVSFGPFAVPTKGVLVVFCDEGLKFAPATRKALGDAAELVMRAAKAESFSGKKNTALDLIVPAGLKVSRLVVVGLGKTTEVKPQDVLKIGGFAIGKLPNSASEATLFADFPGAPMKNEQVADLAQGASLRAYTFDRYKTKRKNDEK